MAMPADGSDIAFVQEELQRHGLTLRGGFDLDEGEALPGDPSGRFRSVLLVGNVGGAMWPHFQRWRSDMAGDALHPLDDWSRSLVEACAADCGASAVFPSDRPFMPFQQWAIRAEGLQASPLGILMHPKYGLWHAYRAALLFDYPLGCVSAETPDHPCDGCAERPCLSACPVGAHSTAGYDYPGCLDHIRSADSGSCMPSGCRDRNACPQASEWRYPSEMQRFLMGAFARAAISAS